MAWTCNTIATAVTNMFEPWLKKGKKNVMEMLRCAMKNKFK
jgi:hypothetical protein